MAPPSFLRWRIRQNAKPPNSAMSPTAAAGTSGFSSNSSTMLGDSTGGASTGALGFSATGAGGGGGATGSAGAAAVSGVGVGAAAGSGVGVGAATATGGIGAAGAAGFASTGAGAAGAVDAPIFFRSSMFLLSSAARALASWAALSLAICASGALLCTEPLDRLSLSGVAVVGFLSSTLASIEPLALRSAATTDAVGALFAKLLRKVLKSLLWATTIWLASAAGTACAWSAPGTFITAPLRMRLILPLTNASGFARKRATSIWSKETPSALVAFAILLAVSPLFTVTVAAPSAGGGAVSVACLETFGVLLPFAEAALLVSTGRAGSVLLTSACGFP